MPGAGPAGRCQAGFITIRNTAASGVAVAITPHKVQAEDRRRYSASSHVPVSPARTFASSCFCSGATLNENARPEMPNNTSDQVIHGVRSFVPRMLEAKTPGHIVNTASVAGLTSAPGLGVYNVSKHAVVTLSETLAKDLAMAGAPIKVSVLCPGFVNTRILDSSRNRPEAFGAERPRPPDLEPVIRSLIAAGMPPAEVAQHVLRAIEEERFYVLTHPDFTAQVGVWPGLDLWQEVQPLAATAGQVRILAAVPSLDTNTCNLETRRFNEEAAALSDDIVIITVSTDLPVAQKRWCGAAGVERVRVVSDHMETEFGVRYGALMKERRWLRRAVFVVDRAGRIVYAAYMPKLGEEPDYAAVLEAARQALARE